MNFIQSKLFIDNEQNVIDFRLKPGEQYYNNVREIVDKGYKQIIIPSDTMIVILKKYFKEKEAKIISIDLLEEDSDYKFQLDSIIQSLRDNRDYFIDLIEELSFLAQKSTVEIKSIRFKYRIDHELIDISISVNGLLNYSDNTHTKEEVDNMKHFIIDQVN